MKLINDALYQLENSENFQWGFCPRTSEAFTYHAESSSSFDISLSAILTSVPTS